jgi:CheY-like chemotaxis protein
VEVSPRPRVLLIDDEAAVRELVGEMLAYLGFEVERASGGEEGLALYARGGHDLVVTDLDMPGSSGWEVLAGVRQRDSELGVVLTVPARQDVDLERARAERATVLPKPFHLAALREAVEHTLRGRAVTRAGADPGAGGRPAEGRVMVHDAPTRFSGELGAVIEAIRKTAGDLDVVAKATEVLLGEHDTLRARLSAIERESQDAQAQNAALRREHDAAVAALTELRRQHETLRLEHEAAVQSLTVAREETQSLAAERQGAVDALEALVTRLRR